MSKKFEDRIVRELILELSKKDSFTVSELAKTLGVSRAYIYTHYPHLLERNENTEKKIFRAIKQLQESEGKKKFTINAVANKANLTRQTISTGYKHLHPYIYAERELPPEYNTDEVTLSCELLQLKNTIKQMKSAHEKALEELKSQYLSELMIKDLKLHEIQTTELSLNKLQVQNDELSAQNRKLLTELVHLKTELTQTKNTLAGGISTQVLGHYRTHYEALKTTTSHQEASKIFLKLEKDNLEKAIESCILSNPDAILFFQPFFSCGIEDVKVKIDAKRIVIIESNCFLPRLYKNLLKSLNGIPVHAITTKSPDLIVSRVFCRQKYGEGLFSDDFLQSHFNNIIPPTIDCGFASVTTITPKRNTFTLVNS